MYEETLASFQGKMSFPDIVFIWIDHKIDRIPEICFPQIRIIEDRFREIAGVKICSRKYGIGKISLHENAVPEDHALEFAF